VISKYSSATILPPRRLLARAPLPPIPGSMDIIIMIMIIIQRAAVATTRLQNTRARCRSLRATIPVNGFYF